GYIGIMQFHGFGLTARNRQAAWDYLKDAPDEWPFVLYKGDLHLLMRTSGNFYIYVTKANECYTLARAFNPRQDIEDRYQYTLNVLKAYDRSPNWNMNGVPYWDSWSFDGGMFYGMCVAGSQNRTAHGWGICTYNSKDKSDMNFKIADYNNNQYYKVFQLYNDHSVYIGDRFADGNLKDGSYITSLGTIYKYENGHVVYSEAAKQKFCPEIVFSYYDF
ncbi:MAG: hypothetical protein IIY05_05430, partial [Alistipes sp.]|nr:hypothetical protein [Alistipes sp.]